MSGPPAATGGRGIASGTARAGSTGSSWKPDRRNGPRRACRETLRFGTPNLRCPETQMPDVRLGALCWNQYADWPSLLAAGRRAEALGYHSLWTWDHLYPIV